MVITDIKQSTEPLTNDTAISLARCNKVVFGIVSNFTIAYGKDKNGSLRLSVRAKSLTEIKEKLKLYSGNS